MRALLVDDHDDSRTLYAEFLRGEGWSVREVTNGAEALLVVASFAPDVIVMDLRMPALNGIEATQRLKEDLQSPAHVVLLTAFPEESQGAAAVGCDEVLTKPCAPEHLLAVLTKVLGRPGP